VPIEYGGNHFQFSAPNSLCYYRILTFASKEPETLEWINSFEHNSILWDIGAKTKEVNVFAFEPSVFNLEFLTRNVNLNGLEAKIVIMPFPLTDKSQFSMFRMTSTEWSGALSSFEKNIGWDGKKMETVFNYQIQGISMNNLIDSLNLSMPDYIKIDVDGIEHFILMGGDTVLKNVKEVLIEVNDNFQEQAELCTEILKRSGLNMVEKRHSEEFEQSGAFGDGKLWNQIWKRN
jgi:FkbM family methyltransferase